MHRDRYSPNLKERYQVTVSQPEILTTKWPRACSGAANAFLGLLGPSMCAAGQDEPVEAGGAKRPHHHPMTIGPDVINFDGLGSRRYRWNRLCSDILGGTDYISSMTALLNLDWMHSTDERKIPQEDLDAGFRDYIWPLLTVLRPRVVCALTNRVWGTILPQIMTCAVSPFKLAFSLADSKDHKPSRDPLIFHFPNCAFPTLLVKPHRHPSRALSYEQCDIIGRVCEMFLNQPA